MRWDVVLALLVGLQAGSGANQDDDCGPNRFKCKSTGSCILLAYRCDGTPECPDGSDETAPECDDSSASNRKCRDGEFACAASRRCLPNSWLCDGEVDCPEDASDEDPSKCNEADKCEWDTLKCPSEFKCVHLRNFCDKTDDCFLMTSTNCTALKCSYKCTPTPFGPRCYCERGFRVSKNTTCIDLDECALDGSCDQLCSNSIGSYNCSCVPGYVSSGRSCKAVNVPSDEPPTLIFSSATSIRRIDLKGNRYKGDSDRKEGQSLAIAFDHRAQKICFIRQRTNPIGLVCASVDSMSDHKDMPNPPLINFYSIIHMALDWVSGNWYFLDDSREIIYLCSSSLEYCTILVDVSLNKPRGITLDPTKGCMFFTKWGTISPTLERANLDGTGRRTLVNQKIVYPFGLTADYPLEQIYWVDTYLDLIERINYDGTNRKTIRKGTPVQNLFDITVFENNLYVTSWRNHSVMRINKYDSYDYEILTNDSKPFSIHVYHRQRQPEVAHPCRTDNGGCEQICIPFWNNNSASAKCSCGSGYKLIKNKKCVAREHHSFLLYGKGHPGMIKGLILSASGDGETMIPVVDLHRPSSIDYDPISQYIYYVDQQPYMIGRQHIDSLNGKETFINSTLSNCEGIAVDTLARNLYWTDEGHETLNVASLVDPSIRRTLFTELAHPRAIVLHLSNGRMYWAEWDVATTKNARIQTAKMDGTDRSVFIQGDLQWPSGLSLDQLRNRLYWCDAYLDRIEYADLSSKERQVLLDSSKLDHPYGLTYFDNRIIWTELQNGTVQSYNLGDETIQVVSEQNPPLFEIKAYGDVKSAVSPCPKCPHLCLLNGTRSATCVCKDGYEGAKCDQVVEHQTENKTCNEYMAKCKTGRCIFKTWFCDGQQDCGPGDLSDEEHCNKTTCSPTMFQCENGLCISPEFFCDGDDDCRDNSDENGCDQRCKKEEFYCVLDDVCIPKEHVCNNVNDCASGWDERSCHDSFCEKGFLCNDGTCIPAEKKCDGTPDCPDSYDEIICETEEKYNKTKGSTLVCKDGDWLCDNKTRCVALQFLCDNKTHCLDRTDESPLCEEPQCPGDCGKSPCFKTPEGPYCVKQDCGPSCLTVHETVAPYLIFSNRHEIRSVDLINLTVRALISSLKNTIALDFYHSEKGDTIYWTDVIDDKIYRGSIISGTIGSIEVVVQTGLATAEGLAVDWVGENLYWVESNLDQIEVAKLNGSYRRALIAGSMESPRAIVLDPRYGLLFWTDWDSKLPRIESCAMTGQNRKIIVKIQEISNGGAWPNGLTLDYDELHVYWIDARSDSIHRVNYDGSNHYEVMRGHELLSHPFAITIYRDSMYWTDWRSNSVLRGSKDNRKPIAVIQRTLTQPFDIQAVHPSRQPHPKFNPCLNNGNCSHLCLIGLNLTRACACPHVMRLDNDNLTCVDNDVILLLVNNKEIRGVDLSAPNTIPTITIPVMDPSQVDFISEPRILFWAEKHTNLIRNTYLNKHVSKTVIDTGVKNPTSLAIDRIAKNIFISTIDNKIIATNLQGEYFTEIYTSQSKITCLCLNPIQGKIYWVESDSIFCSNMDGTGKWTVANGNFKSLTMDINNNILYYINNNLVQSYNIHNRNITTLFNYTNPKSIYYYNNNIYVLDNNSVYINSSVLINYTDASMIKIFNPGRKMMSSCHKNDCDHLCLPVSPTSKSCLCSVGYYKKDDRCVAFDDLIVYSVGYELRSNKSGLLPLSKISSASEIDYDAYGDFLYWSDNDLGMIVRIKRDGTNRTVVVGTDLHDIATGFITGFAYDYISGNVYWADQRLKVIFVSTYDSNFTRVVVQNLDYSPAFLQLDPFRGLLFWAGNRKTVLYSSQADGRDVRAIYRTNDMTGLTLDVKNETIYYSDNRAIYALGYSGHDNITVITFVTEMSVQNLIFYNDHLYWIDPGQDGSMASIKSMSVSPGSGVVTIESGIHETIFDLTVVSSKRRFNQTNACALGKHPCAEICLFDGTKANCACSHGRPVGTQCRGYEEFLIFSLINRLETLHMEGDPDHNSPLPTIKSNTMMRNTIGLAYDYKKSLLFYSDIQKGVINSVYFNGTGHRVITSGQGSVEGMAYDSEYSTLYWTCNTVWTIFKKSILPQDEHKDPEPVIILLKDDKPRGIAVDSCEERLYWTNWNNQHPSIQRAFTNGRMKQSIITSEIRMPNAIALDHAARQLYWADARLDKVEKCDYDGRHRVILSLAKTQHPFAMAVHGDYVFWTDWYTQGVYRADKLTGANSILMKKYETRPMGIAAVANITYDCASAPALPHCERDSDGKCKTKCSADEFDCLDDICIPYHLTCEGQKHCANGLDEDDTYCANRTCIKGYFGCSDGRCIKDEFRCDGVNNCHDKADEMNCTCNSTTHFLCGTGQCISNKLRCDQDPDCSDASDEMGCPFTPCNLFAAPEIEMIKCNKTTACIHRRWICDGNDDCWDNSDEENCTTTPPPPVKCDSTMFKCKTNQSCIKQEWVCDGDQDCPDGSDEENCKHYCQPDQFKCGSDCIPYSYVCDGNKDCPDGSDEHELCIQRACTAREFKCKGTQRCIPSSWVCDGTDDCDGGSDEEEKDCLTNRRFECLPPLKFRCRNNRCIDSEYYCDGENDCGDKSDEPDTCEIDMECAEGEFPCRNGRCIHAALVCNGFDDCGDHSDEDMENTECHNTSCIGDNVFECKNGLCINKTLLCDGENNCGDFSDEDRCNVNECDISNTCAQICIDLPVGYKCSCKPGYKTHPVSPDLCIDVDECEDDEMISPCDQICYNRVGGYECACNDGYILRPDGKTCKADSDIPMQLLFTNKFYIRLMDLRGNMTILTDSLTNAVALDFDWVNKCIYWSDVTTIQSKIQRKCEGKNETEQLHTNVLQSPDGIAVDWVGGNLYWCDKGTNTIEVSKLDGRYRKTLISGSPLQDPRAIVLLPEEGYLFWSEWSEKPHIGKAGMDGSHVRIIIQDNLGWPNALTLDYESRHLYWADARLDYIGMSDYEGNKRKIVLSREKNPNLKLHHVFAIAVFESHIYWTDWELKTIETCRKNGLGGCRSLNKTIHRPMDIHVYHPYRQKPVKNNPCENNGNCSTLCLLTPGDNRLSQKQCACPNDFILKDGECEGACNNAQFKCNTTYKCINFWWKCDTQNDCGDNSDEPEDCPKFNCRLGEFQCHNGNCTHPSDLCNGVDNCGDRSDEKDCDTYTCLSSQFKCSRSNTTQAKCISENLVCNGEKNCPNGEDEKDCKINCTAKNKFACDSGKCIPFVWLCDLNDDCGDKSDEKNTTCLNRTCSESEHRCSNGRCIPNTWLCDGSPDCSDHSDEPEYCHKDMTCDPTYFKCENGQCIPGRWRCDGTNDCQDKSDEKDCTPRECSEAEFKCDNGKCIHQGFRCDGMNNCEDKSDENNCTTTCTVQEFKCKTTPVCIFKEWVCDGDTDCFDDSDEKDCGGHIKCNEDEFSCGDSCVSNRWLCDGEEDCANGRDESEEVCKTRECPPSRFRCTNHRCIPLFKMCDGADDCGDYSDEEEMCQRRHICPSNSFQCKSSGHCISKNMTCDSNRDCPDGSDEESCHTASCDTIACSQTCIEKPGKGFTCQCVEGYTPFDNKLCIADGPPLEILVSIDSTVLTLAPQKEFEVLDTLYANGSKIVSFDINYLQDRIFILFDHVIISRLRSKKENNTIYENHKVHFKCIAYDWMGKSLYVGSDRSLFVLFPGQNRLVTLLKRHMRDIVLDVDYGRMFFVSEHGRELRVESARMDGSDVKTMASTENKDEVVWPTSLALDRATHRLYIADVKRKTIISMNQDGKEKFTINAFHYKPFKIEVFENEIYMIAYGEPVVVKLDKFGRRVNASSNSTMPERGKMARIIVRQKQAQRHLQERCMDKCNNDLSVCLLSGRQNVSCSCVDGSVRSKSSKRCEAIDECYDNYCIGGDCSINEYGLSCRCHPLYSGHRCENYACQDYCKNKGQCVPKKDDPMSPHCLCPSEWTGPRCTVPAKDCNGLCLNGGKCKATGDKTRCDCPPGFTGVWCEQCPELQCGHGGLCVRDEITKKISCNCTHGYKGDRCEISDCQNFCGNDGNCTLTSTGPVCKCLPGFTGKRCEHNICNDYCQNGGLCTKGTWHPNCTCPPKFAGQRCEINLCSCWCPDEKDCVCPQAPLKECHSDCKCRNGGTCVKIGDQNVCRCPEGWGDTECETPVNSRLCSSFCHNGGECNIVRNNPHCYCPDGWSGSQCQSCKRDCKNGGMCDSDGRCLCPDNYDGDLCQNAIPESSTSIALLFFIAVSLFVLIFAAAYYAIKTRARRKPFDHARIRENVEITNPMYEGNLEVADDLPTRVNFDNPVYGMFEEKATLLQEQR